MSAASVWFGIAGWSYPDWRGVVYPKGCKDTLRHVAALVDFIEINSTFYRVPPPDMAASWARRTEDLGTRFSAKLPQEVTHQGRLPAELEAAFRAGLAPLRDAGRLVALLAQFSYRFEASAESIARLRAIAAAFAELAPLALEVRHRSWRDPQWQHAAADLGFTLAHLDYPGAASGFAGPDPALRPPSAVAYLRLHGRNRQAWFRKDAGRDEVYDWTYSSAEVAEIERRIEALGRDSTTTTLVVGNNHFEGKALKVVLELKARHRQESVRVPDGLLAAYPELRAIALGAEPGLFGE